MNWFLGGILVGMGITLLFIGVPTYIFCEFMWRTRNGRMGQHW